MTETLALPRIQDMTELFFTNPISFPTQLLLTPLTLIPLSQRLHSDSYTHGVTPFASAGSSACLVTAQH